MRPPKQVTENNDTMPQDIKDEKLFIMRNFLWNESLSDEDANKAIDAFNKKWMAAGGLLSNSIIKR